MAQTNQVEVSVQNGRICVDEESLVVMHGKKIEWLFVAPLPSGARTGRIEFTDPALHYFPTGSSSVVDITPGSGGTIRGKAPEKPVVGGNPWARIDKYTVSLLNDNGVPVLPPLDPDIRTNGP